METKNVLSPTEKGAYVSGLSNWTADLKGYETLSGKLRPDFPRVHMVNLHLRDGNQGKETGAASGPLKCYGGQYIIVRGKNPFLQVPIGVY